ncbi:O-acetyl-ADP-ribose deacetylase [Desulfotomaculum copahuensis]|uniref:RNase III inhibitor n=1 Tax=Desulfotomaculum copahuensis TaxID=1838280 RepID=A0A1B7LDW6_9FIRM|nr:O-acetyl-ADP-ribose deacetylase [Desulfotomaculum copahuensis]OAT81298.1 RNase III inhibitor [Desulfotomaculum copahuensis]
MEAQVGQARLCLITGDITEQDTEAVVNAANSSLMGGGGVDGAIHRAGGPRILEECRRIVARQGRLPAGRAVITSGGDLKARYVIHTVGPVWSGGGRGEDGLLRSAYRSCLVLAVEHGVKSISFPSISTGAYRFPLARAAGIALYTTRQFLLEHSLMEEIRFVLFRPSDLEVYERAWRELAGRQGI